jgi:hypothetical protein
MAPSRGRVVLFQANKESCGHVSRVPDPLMNDADCVAQGQDNSVGAHVNTLDAVQRRPLCAR